ncbi:SusC/RagA family TonB-linked outer membrane protein [Alkalitalea saponilacus]|uniref:TonB-linked outer membrane protein, SusC/RagA family n=1 Tax=Alkalitalea saponilacus TaxID=889453 RepID=A0A1T5A9L7_9BACT|nr:TonB-dependent receptor [Alkalitalea saponilacus]ASB48791.1 SusC/RagA family TonB-linked outer membrane protein [Alkalitalea saponilacus]SKB31427.1 TonB-linked outer membrane protein, SusC/RagA family [Alkalitalea saponilacus]
MKKIKQRIFYFSKGWFNIRLLISLMMILNGLILSAQNQQTVQGTVVDSRNEPLPGVAIYLRDNTSVGTITDIDGRFTLRLDGENTVVVVSFIGMRTRTLDIAGMTQVNIVMEDEVTVFDEVIIVGFGQQRKESVVGAISQTDSRTLERTGGVSSLGQALTGNLPGVVTMSSSGRPGEEHPDIVIRGVSSWNNSEPLVLVDGVERPMSSVDINSVASISVLKDASATAVFGVRGANGVILITTKRGQEGRASIDVNFTTTLKTHSKLPKLMDSYDALMLRNRVIEHELAYRPEAWSYYQPQAIIDKYRWPANQEEFERYPNVDWVDELLKKYATSYNANVNVSGGSKFAKYFVGLDYTHEGDLYKSFENNRGYETGFGFDRLNVRSNLDFSLTNTTTLRMNLSGSHGVTKGTNFFEWENLVWAAFYGIAPDAFRPKYSDGSFGYYHPSPTHSTTNSMMDLSVNGVGYTTNNRVNTDFTLEQDLGFFLEGLSVQGKFVLDNSFREINRGINDRDDWEAEPMKWIDPETGIEYTNVTVDRNNRFDYQNNIAWFTTPGSVDNNQTFRRMNYSAQINYNNTFGSHTVGAMGNFSREEYSRGSNQPIYREDWVFRGTYDFLRRYMVEFNGAYNGSEKFGVDYRFGFFPSGAVGWMMSEEPMFKNLNLHWVDMLKFRASYGKIGDDRIGWNEFARENRWLYMDTWGYGGAFNHAITGINPAQSPYQWYFEELVGNPNLRWEVATKTGIGLDYAFLGGFLAGSVDYFTERRSDILLQGNRRAIPGYYGANAPVANLGEVDTHGYEVELRWNRPVGRDWRLWGNVFYTHAESEIKYADDPILRPNYQNLAGKPIDQTRAYVDYGYFNNWDELYGSTAHDALDADRMPGNYIILDFDADGIITNFDNIPYAFTGVPQQTMNLQIGADYKGWSGFVQFYGARNVTRYVGLSSLGGIRNTAFDEGSYWSKDDMNADVPLPRWSTQASPYTSGTRFLHDGSYLRLKYAEISYTFGSDDWIRRIGLNNMKVFVNGNNLILWTKMPDDRESNTGGNTAYPTQKRYNLGVRISL